MDQVFTAGVRVLPGPELHRLRIQGRWGLNVEFAQRPVNQCFALQDLHFSLQIGGRVCWRGIVRRAHGSHVEKFMIDALHFKSRAGAVHRRLRDRQQATGSRARENECEQGSLPAPENSPVVEHAALLRIF